MLDHMPTSRNPYYRPPGLPKLQKSVVVLMDMLGYKCMTRRAERDNRCQALLEELYKPLRNARESLEDANLEMVNNPTQKDRFVLRGFTDNIVMGWPLQSSTVTAAGSALRHALAKVSLFQLDMASRGFFFRGAITVGDVFIDEFAVFGTALLNAYVAESEHADTPRIILAACAATTECEYWASCGNPESYPLSQYLRADTDNRRFVNYLNAGLLAPTLITQHRDMVVDKLKEFQTDTKTRRKYRWVAEYHNSFCAEHAEQFAQQIIPVS